MIKNKNFSPKDFKVVHLIVKLGLYPEAVLKALSMNVWQKGKLATEQQAITNVFHPSMFML